MNKKNIFVVGDLVVDHTIFVNKNQNLDRDHESSENEPVYDIIRRQDKAGGAANTARILSILSNGTICLWGILGKSRWGDFRTVLMDSDCPNDNYMPIELRGTHEETEAQITTITRIVAVDPGGSPIYHEIKARLDEYNTTHITEDKRHSVIHYLKRAHYKNPLQAVIINDLDYGCLTKEMIEHIAAFAKENKIALIIDPKKEKDKYDGIEATVIMPNLSEWCALIGQPKRVGHWKKHLEDTDSLREMAEISLKHFKKIKYHIITCDQDGSILIIPDLTTPSHYAIYNVKPEETIPPNVQHQLGCGDVLTGAFAFELVGGEIDSQQMLKAFTFANSVVKCYREMSWQRMPPKDSIDKIEQRQEPIYMTPVSMASLYLPEKKTNVNEFRTAIDGIYSRYEDFRDTIENLINDIVEMDYWNRDTQDIRSIILAAGAGCGKTTIARYVIENLLKNSPNIDVKEISKKEEFDNIFKKSKISYDEKLDKLKTSDKDYLIIKIDEAVSVMGKSYVKTTAKNLIENAHKKGIRFLFIDADLAKGSAIREYIEKGGGSQFLSRNQIYELSHLKDRPMDIALIIAARLLSMGKKEEANLNLVQIEKGVLFNLIDKNLKDNSNPRELVNCLEEVYKKREINNNILIIKDSAQEDVEIYDFHF